MAGENLGEEAKDNEPQGTEPTGEEPKPADQKPDGADDGKGGPDEGVVDKHGQPGINKERHDREIAKKDARIAELETRLDEAAKTEEGRADLKAEIDKLRAEQAEERLAHKLEMAGCVDVKAAKARLDDFGGDVTKLKAECPYLFQAEKKKGATGLEPKGPSTGLDDKIDAAMGVKRKG